VNVAPVQPDVAPGFDAQRSSPSLFARALDDVAAVLDRAQSAEDAYASGTGSLQDAVYERARADVTLSVAEAAAQRTAQALQSIFNLQV
jgi:flagellar hook-basal body complex protein FliE